MAWWNTRAQQQGSTGKPLNTSDMSQQQENEAQSTYSNTKKK